MRAALSPGTTMADRGVAAFRRPSEPVRPRLVPPSVTAAPETAPPVTTSFAQTTVRVSVTMA